MGRSEVLTSVVKWSEV